MRVDRQQNISFRANPNMLVKRGSGLTNSVKPTVMEVVSKPEIKLSFLHKLLGYNGIIATQDGFKIVRANKKGVVRKSITMHNNSTQFEKESFTRNGVSIQKKEYEKKTFIPEPKKVTLYDVEGNPHMEETHGKNYRKVINYQGGARVRDREEAGYSTVENHYNSKGLIKEQYKHYNDGHNVSNSYENDMVKLNQVAIA